MNTKKNLIGFGGYLAHLRRIIVYNHPRLARLARELMLRIWIVLKMLRSSNFINVNKIIWINPEKLKYYSLTLNPMINMGKVIGGDWDKSLKRFEDLKIYNSFKKHFIKGIEWDHTDFYKYLLSELNAGNIVFGCDTKNELDERMRGFDNLYYKIKTEGYISSKEVKDKDFKNYHPFQREDEVTINIGRDGTIFYNDGRHRLTIAKILGISKIPVKVVIRHPEWMNLRNELIEFARNSDGKLYQPLIHSDLQDIPSKYGQLRFNIIKNNLSVNKGKVLDIGAQLGYFCNRLEGEGLDCYAVEHDPINIYFLKKLKKINKKKFKIIFKSIFDYNRGHDLDFDIVLAINIFHHFLKSRKSYEDLIILLKRIKTKEMYFQSHKYDEPQMIGAYRNFKPNEFADFISKYTNLKYKLIGKGEEGRSIFKFYHDENSNL